MKKFALFFCAVLLAGCATGGKGLTLSEAVGHFVENMAKGLPQGSRVAIAASDSPSSGIAEFVMQEFSAAFAEKGFEVADWQNLSYIHKELGLQRSDNISVEDAQDIGKFLGASLAVTWHLTPNGNSYWFSGSAIPVEKSVRGTVFRVKLADAETQRMGEQTAPSVAQAGSDAATPLSAGNFLDRGIRLASHGNHQAAVEDFTTVLKLNPEMSAAFSLRGRALYLGVSRTMGGGAFVKGAQITAEQLRIYERAIADFVLAIRADVNNARLYLERGDVYSEKGDFSRAISDYDQAIKLHHHYAMAYNNRGNAYHNRNDLSRAIADYDQAIKLEPHVALRYTNRGLAHYDNKNFDKAITDYDQAIQIEPNALRYTNRGLAYYSKNNFDKAIADFDQAILLAPNASRYYNRGLAYYAKKDLDRAIADYEQSINLNPNNPDVYYNRGIAYYDKKDLDKALTDFVSELHIDPNNENAKAWFKRVQRER